MQQEVRNNCISTVYESIEEIEEIGIPNALKYNYEIYNNYMKEQKSSAWFGGGVRTPKEAMQKIKDGWPEMLQRLNDMWGDERPELSLAASVVKVRRRKRHRKDYGDTLDMQRVWNGQLDTAWERPEREHRLTATQRHATLYIDMGTTCGTSADATLWRAAAAMLICDILVQAGRAVEIYVGDSGAGAYPGGGPTYMQNAVRVKSYTQPLYMERLAAMVSMAYFRSYGFFTIMANPYKSTPSLGQPIHRGIPCQFEDREKRGELMVCIRSCLTQADAESEFYKVRDALLKAHEENAA